MRLAFDYGFVGWVRRFGEMFFWVNIHIRLWTLKSSGSRARARACCSIAGRVRASRMQLSEVRYICGVHAGRAFTHNKSSVCAECFSEVLC